jgi:Cd2+/Zn2+-exporting ATPase
VLSRTRTVVFDKTGTLTEGMLRVTDLLSLNSLSDDQVLKVVAALEYHSEHHLAGAVLAAAVHRGIDFTHVPVDHFEALPGLGISATIGGERYFLGNERLCRERDGHTSEVESAVRRLAGEGKTTIILGREKEPLAILGFQDTARSQSKESLLALRKAGVETLVMLSGDQESVASRLAEELGIDRIASGLLPGQKAEAVRELRNGYGPVAMVGDGINDAPALAAADTGIGMGVSGVDATLETADVILMSDNLAKLPHLFTLSRSALQAVRQNVALALGIKLVFLMLSLFGISTLWMAVLADDGAALAVIANGLRLLSHKGNL